MTLTPPAADWDNAPLKCLTLNDEWVSFIDGLLHLAQTDKFWSSDVERGIQNIRRIQDALNGECAMAEARRLIVWSQRLPNNVAGGTLISGGNAFAMNHLAGLDVTGFALNGLALDVPAGKYEISGWHYVYRTTANFQLAITLRINGGAELVLGSALNIANVLNPNVAEIRGSFELVAPASLVFWYLISANQNGTTAQGSPANRGKDEIYGQVALWYRA